MDARANSTCAKTPPPTLIDALEALRLDHPERVVFVELDERGGDGRSLTAAALHERARRIARRLVLGRGLGPGDRVLLVYPQGIAVIEAFVACLIAGIIPVPCAPPNPLDPRRGLEVFSRIADNCGATTVLTDKRYARARMLGMIRQIARSGAVRWPDLTWIRTDKINASRGVLPRHRPAPDDVAYLQYTSGSTSAPKGVAITHANIAHQMSLQREAFGVGSDTVGVLWVPYFHDLCLVAGILSALYGNGRLYLMSPLDFLRRPALWPAVMSRVGATHTAAPDFAYRLVVRKTTPVQRSGWDLSCLRVLGAGGEPNRPETIRAFLDAFAPSRVAPEAYCPCYGMAEHSLFIVQSAADEEVEILRVDREALEVRREVVEVEPGTSGGIELVSCGRPSATVAITVVDPDTDRRLPEGRVGEIWLRSASVGRGYYGAPDSPVFSATLDDESGPWLRTGDLGFVHAGQVYLVARLKDLIIVRGRNIYPQDIEATLEARADAVRPGRVVAFSLGAGADEQVIAAAELRDEALRQAEADPASLALLADELSRRILIEHRVTCHALVLARPGALLKTSSGKVRRAACRRAFVEGKLQAEALYVGRPPR